MGDRLLASHILAKVVPLGLLLYLLFGDSGSYTFTAENGVVEECSRSVDHLAIIFGAIGIAIAIFLLRIGLRPRSASEERGALGNKAGAAACAVLAVLLIVTGIAAEGPTDLKTCSDSYDSSEV